MTKRYYTVARVSLASALLTLSSLLVFGSPTALATNPMSESLVTPFTFVEPPTSFGSAGTGPGQFGRESPGSVAVEQSTGDVFVADGGNGRIEKFGPAGEFLSEFGSGTPAGALEGELRALAVDNSSSVSKGDVYVLESNSEAVEKFAPAPTLSEPNAYKWVSQIHVQEPRGMALGPNGDLYVTRWFEGEIFKFSPEGAPLPTVHYPNSISFGAAVAPNGDVYVLDTAETDNYLSVEKLVIGPTGEIESNSIVDPGESASAVTVGPYGDVYVVQKGTKGLGVTEYDSSGAMVEEFGVGAIGFPSGLAFSARTAPTASGYLYVADPTTQEVHVLEQEAPASPAPAISGCTVATPTPTSATISCFVEPNAAEASVDAEYGELTATTETTTPSDQITATGQVTVELTGLQPQARYRLRMVAANTGGTTKGEQEVVKAPAAVSDVSNCGETTTENESATLRGSFEGLGAGPSHWHFQYGPELKLSTKEETVASGKQSKVEAPITGLTPHTSYQCQLVVSDEYGTTLGPASEITTFGPPLLEGENFEKVGSINATLRANYNPEGLGTPVGAAFLASSYYFEYGVASGAPTSYESKTSEATVGEEQGRVAAVAALSGLKPATEYHFRVVATDAHGVTYGENEKFSTFSARSSGLPDGRVDEMVTPPENTNADVYAPEGPIAVGYSDCGCEGVTATHRPFEVATNGNAVTYVGDASTGGNGSIGPGLGDQYLANRTAEGWVQHNITPPNAGIGGPEYRAFATDLSMGVLTTETFAGEQLSPEAPLKYPNIYRRLLSDPNYEPSSANYEALFTEIPKGHIAEEGRGLLFSGASANFSHILFSADAGLLPAASESGGLYESVEGHLSLVNMVKEAMVWPAEFGYGGDYSNDISANGSRVFWTDGVSGDLYMQENGATNVLVAEGGEFWTANSDGSKVFYTRAGDLYEFDVESQQTTDLAPNGEVYGVLGASENGGAVYFVAGGILWKPSEEEEQKAKAAKTTVPQPVAEQPNLYLRRGNETKFVATLSFSDNARGGISYSAHFGDWLRNIGIRTSQVAPDGQAVVFESSNKLTEYNNEGSKEIYVYEAESGEIFCSSCLPTGEPPSGQPWLAVGGEENPTLPGRSMSEDGTRVFFDTDAALVPHDTNGVEDVYEWERDGVGSCEDRKGCIYILSGGANPDPSFLIGTSISGNDVFFESRAQLSPVDQDEAVNLFDAAVSTKPPVEPECTGTSCQGVPFAPTQFEAPSTVTFAGVGNFPPGTEKTEIEPTTTPKKCKKGDVEKKGKCVKKKATKTKKGIKKTGKKGKKAKRSARTLRATRGGVKR